MTWITKQVRILAFGSLYVIAVASMALSLAASSICWAAWALIYRLIGRPDLISELVLQFGVDLPSLPYTRPPTSESVPK